MKNMEVFAETVRQDGRFEVLAHGDGDVWVRLTGISGYGVTMEEAARDFRVDFDGMNRSLIKAVNSSARRVAAVGTDTGPGGEALGMYGMRISCRCESDVVEMVWDAVKGEANSVAEEFLSELQQCKCGF